MYGIAASDSIMRPTSAFALTVNRWRNSPHKDHIPYLEASTFCGNRGVAGFALRSVVLTPVSGHQK